MAWLRLDDGFAQHPKLDGWTSTQKWALVELFLYCARHKTGGYVPADLALLPRAVTRKVLELAEQSGIVDRQDGEFVIHNWEKYNPSDVTAAERMRRHRERNASRNKNRNAAVTAPVTSRARLPSRPSETSNDVSGERPADELWDALVDELGEVTTKTERGQRNAAVKELRDAGATPAQIHARCRAYRRRWPEMALTASALKKHWTSLEPEKRRATAPVDDVVDLPDVSQDERQRNLERARELSQALGRERR